MKYMHDGVMDKWGTFNSVPFVCEFPTGLECPEGKACPLVSLDQRNRSMAEPDAIGGAVVLVGICLVSDCVLSVSWETSVEGPQWSWLPSLGSEKNGRNCLYSGVSPELSSSPLTARTCP